MEKPTPRALTAITLRLRAASEREQTALADWMAAITEYGLGTPQSTATHAVYEAAQTARQALQGQAVALLAQLAGR